MNYRLVQLKENKIKNGKRIETKNKIGNHKISKKYSISEAIPVYNVSVTCFTGYSNSFTISPSSAS